MPGGTPYITPAMLLSRPAGISWATIPVLTSSAAANTAQLAQECWAATSAIDRYCRQPLRAVITTEQDTGPGSSRVSVDRLTGLTTLVTRRWPVVTVEAIQVALSPPWGTFPPAWQLVPAGQWNIRNPPAIQAGPAPAGPSGGNVIDLAPGLVDWRHGKGGWQVMWSYQSGFGAHAGLTAAAGAGTASVQVDDVTGWTGASGYIYDGQQTEPVQVTAAQAASPPALPGIGGTVQAGPGTLTLSAPLSYDHAAGTVISALPGDVIQAAIYQATVQALLGIDAIATQSLSGQMAGGTGALAEEVEMMLDDYRRVA